LCKENLKKFVIVLLLVLDGELRNIKTNEKFEFNKYSCVEKNQQLYNDLGEVFVL